MVIGSLLVWAFVLRDTWEIENSAKVQELCENIAQLADTNDFQGVAVEYDKLISLIGSHKIKAQELCDAIAAANTTKKNTDFKAKVQLEEICKNIKRLDGENNFQGVLDEYNRLVALVGTQTLQEVKFFKSSCESVSRSFERGDWQKVTDKYEKTVALVDPQTKKSYMIDEAAAIRERAEKAKQQAERLLKEEHRKAQNEAKQFSVIDLSWAKLPEGFDGHDIQLIYNIFQEKTSDWTRSEFETKEEWENRIKKTLPFQLKGKLNTDSVLAFMGSNSWKYDAEKKECHTKIFCGGEQPWEIGCIHIVTKGTAAEPYIGQNAFGVKKEISKSIQDAYYIKTSAFDPIEVSIGMTPQEAKIVKDKLKLLYIVKPSLQHITLFGEEIKYISHDYSHNKPTIGDPHDVWRGDHYIFVEVIQIWVVLEDSGEILKKITPLTTKIDGETAS